MNKSDCGVLQTKRDFAAFRSARQIGLPYLNFLNENFPAEIFFFLNPNKHNFSRFFSVRILNFLKLRSSLFNNNFLHDLNSQCPNIGFHKFNSYVASFNPGYKIWFWTFKYPFSLISSNLGCFGKETFGFFIFSSSDYKSCD